MPAFSRSVDRVCVYGRVLYRAKSTDRPFGAPVSYEKTFTLSPTCAAPDGDTSPSKEGTMSYAKPLLDAYPRTFNVDAGVLAATIDALNDCAQACTADADDDLSEQNVTEIGQVHPAMPGLRRRLHRHRRSHEPPDGLRRRRHEAAAGSLRGHMQQLRQRVRAACPDSRALPRLRRGLPALRAGLPGAPGRHEIEEPGQLRAGQGPTSIHPAVAAVTSLP